MNKKWYLDFNIIFSCFIVIFIFALFSLSGCDITDDEISNIKSTLDIKEISNIKNTLDINTSSNVNVSSELYKVINVVDGDTIDIMYNNKKERVRLIGIDTPETKHPTKGVEPYGKEASNFTKDSLLNQYVNIEFDVSERDRYGRLLAYVYLDNVMFNKTLLQQGYAQVSTFPPNIRYVNDFIELQKIARENEIGMWKLELYQDEYESEYSKVNINTATIEQLTRIKHISEERANQIIELRPFNSVYDLIKVKGIGTARVNDIVKQDLVITKD